MTDTAADSGNKKNKTEDKTVDIDEQMPIKVPGIKLYGEGDDMCCWYIPIQWGVIIIGVYMWMYAIQLILGCVDFFGLGGGYFVWGILMGVTAIPIGFGSWWYIKFFKAMDDKEA